MAALFALSQFWPHPSQVVEPPVFNSAEVIYYEFSEYLPPLDTGGPNVESPQRGEPEYAAQPIISVPPEADNRSQTIVTPPNVQLNREVPLPNIVAWSQTDVAVPLAATTRPTADWKTPALAASVVAPAPDVNAASPLRTPLGPQPAIIEPPPSMEQASTRRLGDINIGHTQVVAPAPQLPVAEERALTGVAQAALGGTEAAVVPPPPSIQGSGTSSSGGRLIALGIHPIAPGGPIEVPAGNRRGTFAATPEGTPGAPGTPDIAAGDNHATSGDGTGHGSDGGGSSSNASIPPGIFVGAGPNSAAVPSHAQGDGMGGGASPAQANDSRLIANAAPPRVTSVPRRPASEVSDHDASELERKVFGDRKFYSMTLNMPNLNSAGGSWVIRFAERQQSTDQGELVAPVATQKVDPAYPTELMRRNIQGTVTLYAVIHSDGSVGEVRVLRGVDDQLDEYASTAFVHWHFRPATKNGNPVDLEAVVMIPFRPVRMKSSF